MLVEGSEPSCAKWVVTVRSLRYKYFHAQPMVQVRHPPDQNDVDDALGQNLVFPLDAYTKAGFLIEFEKLSQMMALAETAQHGAPWLRTALGLPAHT